MQLKKLALGLAGVLTPTMAQTPPSTSPATNNSLAISYGTTKVTPGIKLPIQLVSTIPTFSYIPTSSNQTYQLLLVDLSIKTSQLNQSQLVPRVQVPLAPGIAQDRTTRLHYWQTGVTFTSNGTLVNTSEPIAYYMGPTPPPGDIAHTYAFYLFEQGPGFAPPPDGNPFSQALVNAKATNRFSFSVQHLATETGVGPLVAANYITVQNTTATGSASGSSGVASGTAVASGGGGSASSTGAPGGSTAAGGGGAGSTTTPGSTASTTAGGGSASSAAVASKMGGMTGAWGGGILTAIAILASGAYFASTF